MASGLRPEDLARFESIGEAQISPDGSMVVYTLSVQDRSADKAQTSLWLVPAGGRTGTGAICSTGTGAGRGAADVAPRRLTGSGKDRSPRWSKDGKTLAFISDRSGKPQIWLIRVDGGEAWRVPTERAVASIAWSPDGKSIAFTSKDFVKDDGWLPYPGAPDNDRERAIAQAKQALDGTKSAKAGEAATGPTADRAAGGPDKVSDVKVITRFKYKADGSGLLGDLRGHVFVVDVDDKAPASAEPRPAKRLTGGDFDHDAPAWSPDGNYVVLTALRQDDADYFQKQDLWLVHMESGRLIQLYSGDGPASNPAFSPDGSKIAFTGHDGSNGGTTQSGLWVIEVSRFIRELESRLAEPRRDEPPSGSDAGPLSPPPPLTQKDARCLTKALDRPIGPGSASDVHYGMGSPFVWENDTTLLCLIGDRGVGSLYRVSADADGNGAGSDTGSSTSTGHGTGTTPSMVWGDESRNLVAFSCAAGKLAFQIGSPDETEELYAFDEGSASVSRLTDSNPWLADVALGRTERITYKGPAGWDIDGFLTYPVGYVQGKRYPMVLFIHGGPAGAFGSNFMYQSQIMAAKGFAVLSTNPRGSSTYSQEFMQAVVDDWGGDDYLDIMAGVDEVIARGIADPHNLFVTGWSYGGFMTSWVVTQTSRFKAAVGGAIISDRYSMYSTEDIVLTGEHYFGGNPWDDGEKLLSRSPLAYVKNVTTPFMVLHGEMDVRCPTTQGEEFYTALKRLGKTAVLVRYPGEYHGFRQLSHRIDRFARTAAWFEYYAGRE